MTRPVIRTVEDALRHGAAMTGDALRDAFQRANAAIFQRSLRDQEAHVAGELPYVGHLWLRKLDVNGNEVTDLGLVSCRVVTTAGVNFIADAFQGLVEPEAMRFHGLGTGTTAEAVGDTALAAELTTQYSTASTRPQGSLGEKAGSANVFETSATISVSAAVAVTEHGLFSQAAVPGGVLLDRSVFAAINLGAGESLQATYQLSLPSGG